MLVLPDCEYDSASHYYNQFSIVYRKNFSPWEHTLPRKLLEIIVNDPSELLSAFNWDSSPQGHNFWYENYRRKTLTPEAFEILESWCVDLKEVTIEEIDWV